MRKRRSKLLGLPSDVLEQVNVMLDEDASYQTIIEFLNTRGVTDIDVHNISRWKAGGFQDWRNEQERLFQQEQLLNWSLNAARNDSPQRLALALLHYGGAKLFDTINQAETASIRDGLHAKPEVLAQYFQALAWMAKEAVQLQRVQNEAERAEKLVAEESQTRPAPPESVEEAAKRLHLH